MSDHRGEEKQASAPFEATLALTPRDFVGGIVETSVFYRLRGAVLGLIVLLNVVAWRTGALASREGLRSQLITFVGFAIFAYLSPWLAARRQLNALTAGGDANVTYRFDDAAVTIRSATATSKTPYATLVKVVPGKTALLLYTTPREAQVVPRRAFSADQLARVLARVRAHLPAATPA